MSNIDYVLQAIGVPERLWDRVGNIVAVVLVVAVLVAGWASWEYGYVPRLKAIGVE